MNDNHSALTVDAKELQRSTINGIRIALAVTGVLALGLGAFLLFSPEKSTVVAAVIFGLYFVVAGAIRLIAGIVAREIPGGWRVLNILLGLLVLVAGVFILRNPEVGVITLGLLVGLAWIMDGVASLVSTSNDRSRVASVLLGLLSVIAGIVVLFLPEAALSLLFMVGGIFLMIGGLFGLIAAFSFGRQR